MTNLLNLTAFLYSLLGFSKWFVSRLLWIFLNFSVQLFLSIYFFYYSMNTYRHYFSNDDLKWSECLLISSRLLPPLYTYFNPHIYSTQSLFNSEQIYIWKSSNWTNWKCQWTKHFSLQTICYSLLIQLSVWLHSTVCFNFDILFIFQFLSSFHSWYYCFIFNQNHDRVAKLLGYKVFRYNAMPQKPASEFNYEMRFSIQSRKEQDMWNLCWTDSIIGVDFCREMRRFQRINVSFLLNMIWNCKSQS